MIANVKEIRRALLAWHRAHGLRAPWRESGDPYQAMVAAMMAQQTQMSRVLASYERFIAAFPTLDALASATRGDVIRAWRGMGYNTRAARLHEAARAIAARRRWPRDARDLATIPGIGPFTAAIIASFAFGVPSACVDTNVHRVLGRLAADETMSATRLQALADEALARRSPARWNQALMDYGARICTPRPKCGECVVAAWCASRERYASPRALGDERATYDPGPKRARTRPRAPYKGSARWYRGRIVDALRGVPPGRRLPLATLVSRITDGRAAPSVEETRALVQALERDGLASLRMRRGRETVALPESAVEP